MGANKAALEKKVEKEPKNQDESQKVQQQQRLSMKTLDEKIQQRRPSLMKKVDECVLLGIRGSRPEINELKKALEILNKICEVNFDKLSKEFLALNYGAYEVLLEKLSTCLLSKHRKKKSLQDITL